MEINRLFSSTASNITSIHFELFLCISRFALAECDRKVPQERGTLSSKLSPILTMFLRWKLPRFDFVPVSQFSALRSSTRSVNSLTPVKRLLLVID